MLICQVEDFSALLYQFNLAFTGHNQPEFTMNATTLTPSVETTRKLFHFGMLLAGIVIGLVAATSSAFGQTKTSEAEVLDISVLRTERLSTDLRRPDGAQIAVAAICLIFNGQPMEGCEEVKGHYRMAVQVLTARKYASVVPLKEGKIRHDVAFSVESSTAHKAFFVRAFKPKEGLEFQIAIPLLNRDADKLPQKIDEAYRIIKRMANASGDPGSRIK
ncbi:MAG: hypothetical protein IPJ68_00250 [Candidatus Moraniibacteriota bacterium]|nr:MAG: hypothetical protein IPJ68_00250 [Candidatus Moranbacteria bacterium]